MKNTLFIVLLLVLAITSCERDDICIDGITPKLILRFYDFENSELTKPVENIAIRIIGAGIDSLYTDNSTTISTSTDSIAIPLLVTDSETTFIITSNSTDQALISIDTLTLDYTLEEVFIGRSCGFKSVFNDVAYQHTVNWIKNIEVITDTITNETSAHVKIFH
jgi:hypothetical protein